MVKIHGMVKLNKTREILLDYQKSNWESKRGRPIPDKTWRDVSNELSKFEQRYFFYQSFFYLTIFFIVVVGGLLGFLYYI